MTIISILNPKGGSGKTTITTNAVRAFHERGSKVLIVDSDPQGSARDWHATDENNPIDLVGLDRPENLKTLNSLAKGYDLVFIDGAAKHEEMIGACIKISDFVLIPVQPSPYDLWAVSDLVDFIKVRQDVTDGKPLAAFMVTRTVQKTKLGEEIGTALKDHALPILQHQIVQRQIYPQTAAEGQTVFDGSNQDALAEINGICAEIFQMIDSKGEAKKWA